MLNNFKSLLRQHQVTEDVESPSMQRVEPAPDNVTPLTPQPLPTLIGSMGDRAQAAIDELSVTLNDWFEADFQRLISSWKRLEASKNNGKDWQDLFRAAHNLAGMGETYGRPVIGRLCKSLANLLEHQSNSSNIELISLHIDACRATYAAGQKDGCLDEVCEALESEVRKLCVA